MHSETREWLGCVRLLCLLLVLGKPRVQTNAAHGLELYSFICTLATRYTCVLVYRANPASGHGIVTLHDRYVTIHVSCPHDGGIHEHNRVDARRWLAP